MEMSRLICMTSLVNFIAEMSRLICMTSLVNFIAILVFGIDPFGSAVPHLVNALIIMLATCCIMLLAALLIGIGSGAIFSVKVLLDRRRMNDRFARMAGHFSMSTYIMGHITFLAGTPITLVKLLVRNWYCVFFAILLLFTVPVAKSNVITDRSTAQFAVTDTPAIVFKCGLGTKFSASTSAAGFYFQACVEGDVTQNEIQQFYPVDVTAKRDSPSFQMNQFLCVGSHCERQGFHRWKLGSL